MNVRTLKFKVEPIEYGDLGEDRETLGAELRRRGRASTEMANQIISAYWAYKAGVLEREQWIEHRKRVAKSYGELLSDDVRSHYYYDEVRRIGQRIPMILAGRESLPSYSDTNVIPLRGRGVRFQRTSDGDIRARLSILPRLKGRAPRQPVLQVIQGSLRADNERRVTKREMGKLLYRKDVNELLRAMSTGERQCVSARLILSGSQLRLALSTPQEPEPAVVDERLWGLVHVRGNGNVEAFPLIRGEAGVSEAEAEALLITKSNFATPDMLWAHLRETERTYRKRFNRLRGSVDWAGADPRRYRRLTERREDWQRHWINVLANKTVAWCLRNQLEPMVVVERIDRRQALFPPHRIAERIAEVCALEEVGLGCEVGHPGEVSCRTCGGILNLMEGRLVCSCLQKPSKNIS